MIVKLHFYWQTSASRSTRVDRAFCCENYAIRDWRVLVKASVETLSRGVGRGVRRYARFRFVHDRARRVSATPSRKKRCHVRRFRRAFLRTTSSVTWHGISCVCRNHVWLIASWLIGIPMITAIGRSTERHYETLTRDYKLVLCRYTRLH